MAIVNTNTAPILKEGSNITLSQVGQTITITSSAGSAAGGDPTEVQYNSGGALEGDPSFTYNDTTNVVSLESVDFATTPAAADAERRLKWDNDEGSLILTLKGGNVTIPIGAEVVSLVHNAEATTLTKGTVVYAFGASGQRVSVKKAVNTSDATSAQTFGVIVESIAAGAEGFCMVQGMVRGIDTSAYVQGDTLYLSATAGQFTKTKPVSPNHLVYIGFAVKINASSGEIFVRPQNGYEMDEIHDYLEGSVQNNDVISYESSSGLYKPKSIPTLLGYTPMQNPMSVVGDIIYGGASGTPTRLAGRILTSRAFLSSVGDGTNSTAPTWRRISLASDVDDALDYSQGGTGLTSLGTAYDYLRVNAAGTALEYANLSSAFSQGLELLDTYGIKWVTTLGGAGNAFISFTDTSGMAFYSNGLVTPTLFLQDATSRRVGIGTISPSAKLDVNGDVNISTINNATIDTDKFLVSDGGIIKYRTGTELVSDLNVVSGSGTSGYVAYFNGTNSITSDNFYWDDTNDRLGLKTNAPTETLDVDGTAKIRTINQASTTPPKFLVSTAAGLIQYRSGPEILSDIGGAAAADFVTISTAQTISGQKTFSSVIQGDVGLETLDGQGITWRAASYGAANARINFTNTSGMAFYSDGTVTPTMFLSDDGNRRVGIGTTTPSYKLDVNGTGRFSSQIISNGNSFEPTSGTTWQNAAFTTAVNASPYGGGLALIDGTSGFVFFTESSGNILRIASATTSTTPSVKLTLNSSGNLGLGVTPSAWGSPFKALEGGDGDNQQYLAFQTNANDLKIGTNNYYDGANYVYKFNGTATRYDVSNSSFAWNLAGSGTAGNTISFTQAMTLDSSGRLGIGSSATSPTATLQIGTGIGTFDGLAIGGAANRDIRIGQSSTNNLVLAWKYNATAASAYALIETFGGSNNLILQGTGGNVGINTTTPDDKLDVNGGNSGAATFRNTYFFGNDNYAIRIAGDTSKYGYISQYVNDGNLVLASGMRYYGAGPWTPDSTTAESIQLYNGDIYFTTNAGLTAGVNFTPSERMRIKSNGDIKITAGSLLGWSDYSANVSGVGVTAVTSPSETLLFYSAGAERMRITSGGDVRINFNPGGSNGLYFNDVTSNAVMFYIIPATYVGSAPYNANRFLASNSSHIDFETGGSKRMRITSGGDIGINTTSPSYKLDVNGSFAFRSTGYLFDSILYAYNTTTGKYLGFQTDSTGGNISMTDTTTLRLQTNGGSLRTGGSFGVNVNPHATAGRIDASNDIVAYSSDKRLKKNVKEIEDALYKIQKLQGFTYNWNDLAKEKAGFDMDINMVGLFAQDVQEVLPEAVKLAPFDNNGNDESISGENYLTVQYDKLVPLLIEAIKDLNNKYNQLKNGI